MNVTQKGIIALLRSGITGEKLPLPEEFSLDSAFDILCRQAVVPLAYQGAVNCGIPQNHPVMQKIMMICYRNLMKHERQMIALERIFREFENQAIDYLPLKGCTLKRMYPKPELRAMGDADILIRMEQYPAISAILKNMGYDEKRESHHELVWVSNDLYLELHKCLFEPAEQNLYSYFGIGWERAQKENHYKFSLKPEDNYVYLFAHLTKHYRFSGVGCRQILDLFVFRRNNPCMNEPYIECAMKKLNLLEFYQNISRLLSVWFEGFDWDEKSEFITDSIFSGGSWGNGETRFCTEEIRAQSFDERAGNARGRLIIRAIFPPAEKLQHDYKILEKYPLLHPLFWFPRWIKGIICRPGEIIRKFSVLIKISDEKVSERRSALEYVGLKPEER